MSDSPAFFTLPDGIRLAYRHRAGSGPTILFLPGYMSDMGGTKALALDGWAAEHGRGMLRFDYSGCGESDGRFADGTLTRWRDDALAVIDAVTAGPLVLVGSSMGGWLMLLVALARPDRVAALVGIAAAPDFTEWGYGEEARATLLRDGRLEEPSAYSDQPFVTTRAFWEDGQANRLLDTPIPFAGPVRLLHGQADADVPWAVSLRLADALTSPDVHVTLVKDGDHRLSREGDIALLTGVVQSLIDPPPRSS
jgi:pimeloyl-ACP methyl ester carboxylesterase